LILVLLSTLRENSCGASGRFAIAKPLGSPSNASSWHL